MNTKLKLINVNNPNYDVEVSYDESVKFIVRYINDRSTGVFLFDNEILSTIPQREIQRLKRLIRIFIDEYIEQL